MEALFNGESTFDATASESVQNIVARYGDIEELFPRSVGDAHFPTSSTG